MFLALRRIQFAKTQKKADALIEQLFGHTKSEPHMKLSLQKSRNLRSDELSKYNQKVRNYHRYQYFRGEDFIENIPYSPSRTYTLRDSIADQKEKERETIEELQPMLNHQERAQIIRQRINAYHDKQKKYQIQEFQKYLREYPGTVKGSRPQDDPQAYREYALKKMPRILLEEMQQAERERLELQEQKNEEDDSNVEFPRPEVKSIGSVLNCLDKDRIMLDPDNKEQQAAFFHEFDAGFQGQQIADGCNSEVPLIPSLEFENYQHFINYWTSWLEFRNSYINHNMKENMKQLEQMTNHITESMIEEEEWMDIPSNIPSLYRYYKCLPKEIQDHPGLKDIYLGMQYKSPDFSYQEKEEALNKVCPLFMPFDDVSMRVMTEYTAASRRPLPIFMYDKVFTISPQFTWDFDQFVDEIRKQELRGETTNQDKDAMYPAPPQVHKMWEEGAPNLPVDFYDNDDGFWDEIISQKLKRYDECTPMLKTRKYFTH